MAAKLAEEAREMEKESDTLVRRPHSKSGEPQIKTLLRTPPTLDKEVYQRWLKTIEPSVEYTESLVEGPRLKVEEEEPCLRVPPTLDKEVYQRWLKTIEPSVEYTESLVEGPHIGVEEEEPCLRVPPTLDKEVYQRWLKTMGQNT